MCIKCESPFCENKLPEDVSKHAFYYGMHFCSYLCKVEYEELISSTFCSLERPANYCFYCGQGFGQNHEGTYSPSAIDGEHHWFCCNQHYHKWWTEQNNKKSPK